MHAAEIRAVLFDLDDTLTDRLASVRAYALQFITDFGERFRLADVAAVAAELVRIDRNGYNHDRASDLEEHDAWISSPGVDVLAEHWDHYFAVCTQPREGLSATMDALAEAGIRLGVVTSGLTDKQRRKIQALGLQERLGAVLISEEFGFAKPDEKIFRAAAAKLGVHTCDCMFIGDNPERRAWSIGGRYACRVVPRDAAVARRSCSTAGERGLASRGTRARMESSTGAFTVRTLPESFLIRTFQPADRGALEKFWQRVFPDDPPWNAPAAMIDKKLEVQPELLLIGEADTTLVGAVIAGYDGVRGWIYHLAVAPEFRRRGLATQLVRAAENDLRRLGCPKVNLQIRATNHEVVAFYRSLGYAIEERVSMGRRLDGVR